jgi:hypothetical protein
MGRNHETQRTLNYTSESIIEQLHGPLYTGRFTCILHGLEIVWRTAER